MEIISFNQNSDSRDEKKSGKKEDRNNKKSFLSSKIRIISAGFLGAVILSFLITVIVRVHVFSKLTECAPLTGEQQSELSKILHAEYPEQNQTVHPLPYDVSETELDVLAKSAILIDVSNGSVLYEKNADEIIPPASMTKLFSMFVVDEYVSEGKVNYDDVIPLPPECWACNMPPHSSLMFLGEGQKVTLEELILGLAICSGNDAAYALAYTVCGSMDAFVEKMNQAAAAYGLTHTHFVESSGYSELNTTTAREMAAFCRIYLQKHPDSLERFHSVSEFTYPKEKNLAPGDVSAAQDFSQGFPAHITMPITQKNTNPLLGKLEGCDGLKTGYIDESGYNLSLTVKRNGTRFLSVTMGGPGKNASEGQAGRVHDGTELMEWAFSNFKDYFIIPDGFNMIAAYGTKEKAAELVYAFDFTSVTVPFIYGNSVEETMEKVHFEMEKPSKLSGKISAGTVLGYAEVKADDLTLIKVPLVCDRNLHSENFWIYAADSVAALFTK